MNVPDYWMNEASGRLAPAVEAYLRGDELTLEQVAEMRAYLRQWIDALWIDLGETGRLRELRLRVDTIRTTGGLRGWLADALDLGIDPL